MSGGDKTRAVIDIERIGQGDPMTFDVMVREGEGATRHAVTLSREMQDRLSDSRREPGEIIEAAFRFLLARERKESILANFDLSVISRYFPEFERELPRYFTGRR